MSRTLPPIVAALAAVGVAVAAFVLAGSAAAGDEVPEGIALTAADRSAVAAVPVVRGEAPAPVDPGVDRSDPAAVVRAYLAAAHSITGGDTGRTQLRGAGYAAPGSPPATVGRIVLDPPPAGSVRTATVTALDLVAVDRADRRRGFRAELGLATGPPGGVASVDVRVRDVVLTRDESGHWLVVSDTTPTPDLPAGED